MPNRFLVALSTSTTPLLSDGAMGTMLNARGIGFDQCLDELNLTQPDAVADIHRAYIEAGSNLIQTNTFGANRYKLAAHSLQARVNQINRTAVELARQVVSASSREVLIAGDVGPLGVRLAPFGRIQPAEARAAFQQQIATLAEAGVDVIIIETFTDLYEIREAVMAAREAAPSIPVIASMTFTRDDRTLLGDTPQTVARALAESSADVIGVNCSGGPAQIFRIIKQMRAAVGANLVGQTHSSGKEEKSSPYLSVMPNAGWPEQVGGRIMYPANPAYFGDYAQAFCELGVSVIGGCCGTTPQHIAAMRQSLDREPEGCSPLLKEVTEIVETADISIAPPSQLAQKMAAGKWVVSVEMDPPRGLSTHKLIAGASLLAEAGADVINVADSPMARMRMSPWAVCDLIQRHVGVETTLHFPTRGRNLLRVQGDLLAAHALGIRNVFVVMGDPTAIGDYPDAMDDYDLVPSGLIKLIKQNFNAGRDHAGGEIGQPTSFIVGGALNLTAQDVDGEIKNLRRKVKAGVDFLLTQPVFQPEVAADFLKHYEDMHDSLGVPILVGVLPLYGLRHAIFMNNEVPGISISDEIFRRLESAGDDAPREGVKIALELIAQMRSWASGVYIMPQFSRYDLAAEIIEGIDR